MKPGRLALTAVIGLWLGTVLQQALSPKMAIFGARPDFLLIFLAPLSLLVPRRLGAIFGFFCGLLQGAIVGEKLAQYIVSRTVSGFIGSWSKDIGFEINNAVVGVTGFVLTLVARLLYMFLAAPHQVISFLGDTIGSAMYNGVFAIPVYMLLRRILNPSARSGR